MLIRVRGKGIKLNGKWCYKDEEVIIDEAQYEENKNYVDIIEDEEGETLPTVPETNDKDDDQIKLLELRTKAKELGIRNYHLMGKEKLEEQIAEKEAPLFGQKTDEKPDEKPDNSDIKPDNANKNPDENDLNDNNGEGATGENNPQE